MIHSIPTGLENLKRDARENWLNSNSDVRNQLSCYVREVVGLMNQCKFLWTGAALIGIHVTYLYMSMLLEHKVTPRNLLDIFPRL